MVRISPKCNPKLESKTTSSQILIKRLTIDNTFIESYADKKTPHLLCVLIDDNIAESILISTSCLLVFYTYLELCNIWVKKFWCN